MAKVSRQHLEMNGFYKKKIAKLSDAEAIEIANQHMRAFLGMDRPNIFTSSDTD